ncbi:hypothetical protein LPB67_14900 [Undibacterium sp. Jales W-56]|uniref:hypothetical protein n=1 Tax=Undibacterium sp. Jales W-56 TaxID=2897325 RepID=UPI0021D0404A|nr:hypothetical protein [Undibacterium sp. Jales W-56]MCU6435064.1 hypothetical protein [Undibacterium sp. Jales W-56]
MKTVAGIIYFLQLLKEKGAVSVLQETAPEKNILNRYRVTQLIGLTQKPNLSPQRHGDTEKRRERKGTMAFRYSNGPASWVRLLARNAAETLIQHAGSMYVVVSSVSFCVSPELICFSSTEAPDTCL